MAADIPPLRTKKPDLSIQEIRFCQNYASSENITQSVREANFNPAPVSDGACSQLGRRLLRKRVVRHYIRELQDSACESARATINQLARGFMRAAEADVTVIFDDEGSILPPRRWPAELRSAICGLEVEALFDWVDEDGKQRRIQVGNKYKIKLENKTEARKILAQWRGMIGGKDKDPEEAVPKVPLDVVTKLIAQSQAVPEGNGTAQVDDPVEPESGSAESCVSE